MSVRRFALLLLTNLIWSAVVPRAESQTLRPTAESVARWQSHKFGMFIHFGLYSELGGVWRGKNYDGNYSEQIQSDAHIPETEYAALAHTFRPKRWDADAIVQLARGAGMQFIVLTAKHHDGFNLFRTHQTKFNAVDGTPSDATSLRLWPTPAPASKCRSVFITRQSTGITATRQNLATTIASQRRTRSSMRGN